MTSIAPRIAAAASLAAAPVLLLTAVLQLADEQSSESTTVGVEHLTVACLAAFLVLMAPVTLHLGQRAAAARRALIPAAGMLVLAALSTVSNVRGSDPSFFAAVAAPANLLWLGGWIALSVVLVRRRALPRALAIGLPLLWIAVIPGSTIGLGVLGAAYCTVLARTLRTDGRARFRPSVRDPRTVARAPSRHVHAATADRRVRRRGVLDGGGQPAPR